MEQKSWFIRHLHWAWLFGLASVFILMVIMDAVIYSLDEYILDSTVEAANNVIWIPAYFIMSGWVILMKKRSLWWVLLSGWLSHLWLSNHSDR